jgi:hypothetical protein
MSKTHQDIDSNLALWIREQHMFFVATAPLAGQGHINCSPKGGSTFVILDSVTVAYQDLTGSGIETIAHLKENGRIVIMFCAFKGAPKIVRLHGQGEVLTAGHQDFAALAAKFPENPGTRAVIRVKVDRVSDSCGMAVPFYNYMEDRDALDKWARTKGEAGVKEYRQSKNTQSIDGLEGLVGEG